ncbi:hypothetical protein C2R22_20220 [Salinigranum rubrum]|uniref:Sjogren's syndrome/scleroderma autoantigen 1 (Autoantigen p27) n=1 Tax=Salinigranum rubrum TaxID=755307 RepID=A0A2I8VP35_9EURY|nr:Sjogren's syndrome/scleroderma autoantigen 1 family protein [Salinigranum rubrum]AUV83682.1 hypothetical protein C2R22_20220 [Salinigranum rubrum]
MSDFDKEAERQKLREKFDRDKQKRKETERMSQLLLQGATMTNRHCDTCGDPLFRYQGQEFCATCEGRAQEADEQAQAQAQTESDAKPATTDETAAAAEAAEGTGAADPTTNERALDADAAGHPTGQGGGGYGDDAESMVETAAGTSGHAGTGADRDTTNTGARTAETRTGTGRTTSTGSASVGGDALADARASLVRTLTHHAQQAEAADGPRRATDHLSAAREAAEALAALERGR